MALAVPRLVGVLNSTIALFAKSLAEVHPAKQIYSNSLWGFYCIQPLLGLYSHL